MKFKAIKVFKGYSYYIDLNIIDENLYQELTDLTFSGVIVDENEVELETFDFTLVDNYTIKASLSTTKTYSIGLGNHKYKIDFTQTDGQKFLALYGDFEVVSVYES